LNYATTLEKADEKRPGIDRDHQGLRPDSLVLQPHESVPRKHCFVLGERIERTLYGPRKTLIAAKDTKNCQRLVEDANLASRASQSVYRRRDQYGLDEEGYQ
jgi:hypothetical protein